MHEAYLASVFRHDPVWTHSYTTYSFMLWSPTSACAYQASFDDGVLPTSMTTGTLCTSPQNGTVV